MAEIRSAAKAVRPGGRRYDRPAGKGVSAVFLLFKLSGRGREQIVNDLQQFLGVVVIFSGSYYNNGEACGGGTPPQAIREVAASNFIPVSPRTKKFYSIFFKKSRIPKAESLAALRRERNP